VLMTEGLVAVVGFENVAVCASPIGGIRELGGEIIGSRFSFLLPYQSISLLYPQLRAEDSATSISASHIVFRDSGSSGDMGCGSRFRARRHNFR
jgi:hypothetical protein